MTTALTKQTDNKHEAAFLGLVFAHPLVREATLSAIESAVTKNPGKYGFYKTPIGPHGDTLRLVAAIRAAVKVVQTEETLKEAEAIVS